MKNILLANKFYRTTLKLLSNLCVQLNVGKFPNKNSILYFAVQNSST